MIIDTFLAAAAVALISFVGVLFFGRSGHLSGIGHYSIPVAVGVFLSLILFELIPETLAVQPEYGPFVIAFGFISFYVLAHLLHKKFHTSEADDCDSKGAAILLLIGDSIHNVADGVVIGGAFMIDPTVGLLTTIGLALHEIPQEIVEFGVLVRAGYTHKRALFLNLISASSIFIGVLAIALVTEHAAEYTWILLGVAAGNLLFLALSDLLPRIHGGLKKYGSIWHAAVSITLGFVIMGSVLIWTHENFTQGHLHTEYLGEEMHEEDEEEQDADEAGVRDHSDDA